MTELLIGTLQNISRSFHVIAKWTFSRPEKFALIWALLTCIYIYVLILIEERKERKIK